MEKYIVLLSFYILGSIPFSLIIARIKGINLREVGSGNVGATNIARITGDKRLAAMALFLDSLKGFIAVHVAQKFFDNCSSYILISAILSVLGHMFPIWLRFVGGKGISTTFGILIALSVHMALAFIFVWLLVFFFYRYSSLSSLVAIAIVIFMSLFFQKKDLFFTILTVGMLVFFKHYRNIANLLQGKEYKFL